jgi:2-hydroxy-6-oxonona-2,4-dienedioate hydrolase
MNNATQAPSYRSIWMHLMRSPLKQDWVDAGGIRTRYMETGKPGMPVLIMLHGTAGSLEAFCANLGAHGERYHCFAIDMVGAGFSDKPDTDYEIPVYVRHVRAFMDAMNIDKASFIGVSLGAWIAARFALTHPDRVDRLTLLSAAGRVANAGTMKQIKSLRSKAVEDPSWDNIKPIFDDLLHREESRIDDLIGLRQAVYRQDGMARAMQHILCLQDPEIRPRNLLSEEEWRAITAPALVIGSLEDKGEFLATARYVAEVMPNARYVEMEQVNHWPQFEDYETFNRINLEFLAEGR